MKSTIKVAFILKYLLVTNEVFGLLITIVMVIVASASFWSLTRMGITEMKICLTGGSAFISFVHAHI